MTSTADFRPAASCTTESRATESRPAESRATESRPAESRATDSSANGSSARKNLRFALHYAEMVVAMFAGMFVLGALWSWAWPGLSDRPVLDTLVMAVDMTVGMAAWMLIRRHRWSLILEMSVAMLLPFLVLLVPYGFGAIDGHALMMGGHMLMFVTMLAAMLWRHRDYRH